LILPAILSPALIDIVASDQPTYFAIYPVANVDLQTNNLHHARL